MGEIHNLENGHSNRNLRVDSHTSGQYKQTLAALLLFRDKSGWSKYHNLKDLAISLDLEASEVLEIFQWKKAGEQLDDKERIHLEEELADVLSYTFFMCDKLDLDPAKLVAAKTKINNQRTWDI